MNRTFARGVAVSLAVVGVAALIWWLLASGRFDRSLAPNASNAPAEQTKSRVAAPEKPASPIAEANKAIKDLGDRLGPSTPLPPANADPAPAFDVARVDASGEAVIAGRATANSSIELLVDGQVHDRTTADASGAFVFVPKPLPPGKYDVTLRATTPEGKVTMSKTAVAVAVGVTGTPPVAALAAPPPAALQSPSAPEASKPRDDVASKPAASAGTALRIESVEPEAGGGLFVSGRAAPGSRIRLYLNDGYIAMGTASADGRVSFSIGSGVRPGDYRIRLEQLSASDSVASRVEMPFRAPATVAAQAPSPATPNSVIAAIPSTREAAPAASVMLPSQPADQKPASPPAPSLVSPVQPAAPGSAQKDLSSGPATDPVQRSASAGPAAKSQTASEPASASPAVGPNTRSADNEKSDVPRSQPAAQSPAVRPESKSASNASPRIASPGKDRRDAVVIPRIDTKLIIRGDNLWRISEATYGLGKRYTVIFGANRDKIRDPDLIFPGQIFVLPKSRSKQ